MSCAYPIGLGIVLGGGLGYALSRGLCAGGGCPITSNRALMVLIGAFFGGWLALSGCSRGAGGKAETAPADAGGEVTTPEQFAGRVVEAGTPALVGFGTLCTTAPTAGTVGQLFLLQDSTAVQLAATNASADLVYFALSTTTAIS